MPARVVDASAVAALLFDEPAAEEVEARLRGMRLLAPHLLPYEVASVCIKKSARRPADRERLQRAIARLDRLGIRPRRVSAASMTALAAETRLSAYDAAYLWLALESGVPLVTLDGRLAEVASSFGLSG